MLHYRKTFEIVAYTYDADIHCLECTEKRFGPATGYAEGPVYEGIDSEGNEIHPVFLEDMDFAEGCGDCFAKIE